ncbi:MAG: hypothetical protein JW717_08390 [Marinilabiliaceae bacterium]|nr:hypothetical protein [Marinilabiliaceae bacterium]
MNSIIKVFFVDFWENFNPYNNHFLDALKKNHNVEVTSKDPDLLFYSWLGDNQKYFKCTKIFYTPEIISPKYWECDYALSFQRWKDGKNLRYPNYLLYNYSASQLIKNKDEIKNLIDQKRGFCSFIVSNPNASKRIEFFNKLSKYKKVDSGGRYINNIGGPVNNKIEFLSQYKFNIAFENCISDGYTTEKIVDAMIGNTIPIYWGNPYIEEEFNTKSFFNYDNYQTEDDLIDDIISHDKDPEKYYNKFIEPWFHNNQPNEFWNEDRLALFLKYVVNSIPNKKPISKNWLKKEIYYPIGKKVVPYLSHIKRIIK